LALALLTALAWSGLSQAMPGFARQYEMSCSVCHSAYPRLNAFGETFRDEFNMRLPNWKEKTVSGGDERLALPPSVPLGIRAQAFVQGRDGEEIDPLTGPTGNGSSFDFQAPYLIKLITSAPLSDHITFYAYGILAEKGDNGTVLIEDAWFSHDDAFGTGIGAQLGQFQVSDLMFPRETRLTFQDFQVYRMAGITYERGILLGRALGPVDVSLGAVNGNGINANVNINSPGLRRPDRMFDNDDSKSVFLRLGTKVGLVSAGLFGLTGEQRSAAGAAGQLTGNRDTDRQIYGIDVSGQRGAKTHWFAQALWNEWDGFLDSTPSRDFSWFGGFAGVDYIHSDRWTFSLLYNYNDAGDFDGTQTLFEGLQMNTLTLGASYYFMRNVKGVLEVNADLLSRDNDADFVGHETRENYLLVGFDAAF
jgi:opacity protein-like surface antigen